MVKRLLLSMILVVLAGPGVAGEYSLNDLYRIALDRSEKVRITGEDLYIAGMTKEKAKSVLMPKLTSFASYVQFLDKKIGETRSSILQPDSSRNWGVRLDQSMSLSGREITAFRITEDGIRKSRYDLDAAKEGYMLAVAGAYYDHLRARKLLEISEVNVRRLTKHRDAAAVLVKVGEVTKTALLRAEAELSGARSEMVRAVNDEKLSKAVLARTVGIDEEFRLSDSYDSIDIVEVDKLIEGCKPLTTSCLKARAGKERAELKSLATQKKISEDQVTFVKGSFYPTLSAEGVYTRKDESPPPGGLVRESVFGGLRMTFPFFEGGLRVAEVSEAEARKRQAIYTFEDNKKSVSIEVEEAYLDFMTQTGVLKSLEDQQTFARDNYSAVARQFELGLANSVDVMDANTLLVTAERQLLDAIYGYRLAAVKLKRSAGVLLRSVFGDSGYGVGHRRGPEE